MVSDPITKQVRVRSAPSPTGRPHIGTVYNALFNYVFARKHRGQFVLRIEDTDRERYVVGAEAEIFESLRWLGLEPDESPEKGGPFGPYRQSERLEIYKKYALELVEKGAAYYCFCSKDRLEELRGKCEAEHRAPMYDGCCREGDLKEAVKRVAAGEPYVIRLKVPREGVIKFIDIARGEIEIENAVIDDQVLLKSDGFPTYHLANVVDDHLMEITHIIRGEEWLSSVPKHVLLYQAFGWEIPVYAHTALVRGKDKSKLSKRHGSPPIPEYRTQGFLPEALRNYWALLGWTHPEEKEVFDLQEMISKFRLEDLNTTAPVFDFDKLTWLNGKWLRSLPPDELATRLEAFGVSHVPRERILAILPLVQERMETLPDFETLTNFFFAAPEIDSSLLVPKGRTDEEAKAMLAAAVGILEAGNLDRDWLEAEFRSQAEKNGWKMGELCMAVRVAVTGAPISPPLLESIGILGRAEVQSRLKAAENLL